jgi:hypothetical protein
MQPSTKEVGVGHRVDLLLLLDRDMKFVGLERGILLVEEALGLLWKMVFRDI